MIKHKLNNTSSQQIVGNTDLESVQLKKKIKKKERKKEKKKHTFQLNIEIPPVKTLDRV